MGWIYVIKNNINSKIYVGQTVQSLDLRFKEHINDVMDNCIIHKAMRKYGINNFWIEPIEECDNNLLNDKEKYWIQYFDSYKNGYNATLGGEGYQRYSIEELKEYYFKNNSSFRRTAKHFKCSPVTVYRLFKGHNINVNNNKGGRPSIGYDKIIQLDKQTNEILNIFDSLKDVGEFLGSQSRKTHVSDCIKGKRKSAYGYKWEGISNEDII